MEIVQYLKDIYGYGTPIVLKDIRIGRKSKTAIRKELSRATKENKIIRRSQGVYYFKEDSDMPKELSFEEIVTRKFVCDDGGVKGFDFFTFGYFSGQTFLNMIGISQQVPAVLEITTNKTSCKRIFTSGGYRAVLRKGRTDITFQNYKILQFFDMLASFITIDQIRENQKLLYKYIENNFTKNDLYTYIRYYKNKVMKILVEEKLIEAFQ